MAKDYKTTASLEDLLKKAHKGIIKPQEIHKVILDTDYTQWNARTQPNPAYSHKDNSTRTKGFKYHMENVRGQKFQFIAKPIIRKSVNIVWELFQKYDKDIFVYDDPRLQRLNEFMKAYIMQNFNDSQHKLDVMTRGVDIVLGLMKEDVFYISRILDGYNTSLKLFPDGFELMDSEKTNLDMVRLEEYHCVKCNKVHQEKPRCCATDIKTHDFLGFCCS